MSTGKRAVVTGGANGIGQAFCKRLAAQGANIVIADIADCSETVGAIKKSGGAAIAARCDQTSEADVAELRAIVETELGGCDILVHCAGIYPTAAIDEITFAQWRKVLSVNLDSVFLLVKAFLPAMKEQRWGRIISVSSTTFHSGIGFNTHYTASKGGLIGFARSLASEVGDFGITVNTIAPGLTRTDTTVNGKPGEFGWFDMIREQQAIKRTETPEDLTGTLAFLASEDAAFITGQTIVVDGGWKILVAVGIRRELKHETDIVLADSILADNISVELCSLGQLFFAWPAFFVSARRKSDGLHIQRKRTSVPDFGRARARTHFFRQSGAGQHRRHARRRHALQKGRRISPALA